MSQSICYYYKVINDNHKSVYRCLFDGRNDVVEKKCLDLQNCKNFRMNDKYEALDKELIRFRDEFLGFNDDLRKPFFKNKDKKTFKVNILNYRSTNHAVLNNLQMNSDQERINKIPNIHKREFMI